MNKEQIGLRIKLERTKQNLTQEQLAEMADISSSYLSAIEPVSYTHLFCLHYFIFIL